MGRRANIRLARSMPPPSAKDWEKTIESGHCMAGTVAPHPHRYATARKILLNRLKLLSQTLRAGG